MNERGQSNIQDINELWRIHNYSHNVPGYTEEMALLGRGVGGDTRCLAFIIDKRFLDSGEVRGLQLRLGVSFGDNPFTPRMATGFLPPPILPGRFVFGVHLIATLSDTLTLYAPWCDAFDAGECEDAIQAIEIAERFLESKSDETYLGMVGCIGDADGPLRVSSRFLLRDFDVVE